LRSLRGKKRGRAKIPGGRPLSNLLPFCPPERKLSKVSVRIFFEKSSDFVQDREHFKRRSRDQNASKKIELTLFSKLKIFNPDPQIFQLVNFKNGTIRCDSRERKMGSTLFF